MSDVIKKEVQLFTYLVIGYGTLYFLNNALTDALYVVPGAHIIHLPSGLKIFMVMVTGFTGALAIALVGFLWSSLYMFKENFPLTVLLALVSGLAPWLSLRLLRRKIQLKADLSDLNWKKLLAIVLAFALLNSTCLQLIVYAFDESDKLLNGIWVMLVGDITGIFIVIYSVRFLIKAREAINSSMTNNSLRRTAHSQEPTASELPSTIDNSTFVSSKSR